MVVESSDDCDFGRVRSVVGRWLPEFEMTSTTKLGEGVDHVANDVDARLIAGFGTDPDQAVRAERANREARLQPSSSAAAGNGRALRLCLPGGSAPSATADGVSVPMSRARMVR
jgi:hypothetical protein